MYLYTWVYSSDYLTHNKMKITIITLIVKITVITIIINAFSKITHAYLHVFVTFYEQTAHLFLLFISILFHI